MRLLLAIILLALPVAALSQAPATAPVVRTTVRPAEGIVIGQPVTVNVAVLFPGEMQHPPLVTIPEAAGAQIMRFESQGTTIRDRIDGQDYVGQAFAFMLFPRRGGAIEIPAPTVTLLDRGGDPIGSAKGNAASLVVTVPPGVDPSSPVLVADRVAVEQSWSPDAAAAQFRAGDAVLRTIRREAEGVPALGMAEFRFTAPEGVRVYVDPPVVDDRSTQLGVDGHRTDRVTYVFEQPGTYELPALAQPWLTPGSTDIREQTLPGTKVVVMAATSAQGSIWWPIASGIACIALVAMLLVRSGLRRWRVAHARWLNSPEFYRRALAQAARKGDPRETYAAALRWRRTLSPAQNEALMADDAFAAQFARLEKALFETHDAAWSGSDGHALARAVASLRSTPHRGPRTGKLPRLNPSVRSAG